MRCGVFVCDLCVNVTLYGGLRWTKQNNVFVLISHISAGANRASDFAPRIPGLTLTGLRRSVAGVLARNSGQIMSEPVKAHQRSIKSRFARPYGHI